ERTKKCTVAALRGREGFVFWKFPHRGPQPLENYVRLGLDGPRLSEQDTDKGLLILDGTWRWAAKMQADYQHVPTRSLPAWKTAYPRVSHWFDDPQEGLATIEAIFAAYVALGRDTTGLLDDYHWAEQFLELNRERCPDPCG
ncbi:MAG: hypothetical protein ACREIV_01125, partial [Planctomycetaceae bacterium]